MLATRSPTVSNDIPSMRRRRNHHAFTGWQIECLSSGKIDALFWLRGHGLDRAQLSDPGD
jgi:hypothetical protein